MPHYVLDLRTLTLGKRHDTRDKAVAEFEKLKTASPSDHALAVVEVNYMRGSNGLPQHVSCSAPLELKELQMNIDQPATNIETDRVIPVTEPVEELRIIDADLCVWCEQTPGVCTCDVEDGDEGAQYCPGCDERPEDCECYPSDLCARCSDCITEHESFANGGYCTPCKDMSRAGCDG